MSVTRVPGHVTRGVVPPCKNGRKRTPLPPSPPPPHDEKPKPVSSRHGVLILPLMKRSTSDHASIPPRSRYQQSNVGIPGMNRGRRVTHSVLRVFPRRLDPVTEQVNVRGVWHLRRHKQAGTRRSLVCLKSLPPHTAHSTKASRGRERHTRQDSRNATSCSEFGVHPREPCLEWRDPSKN